MFFETQCTCYVQFRSTGSTSVIIAFSLSQHANPHHPLHISSSVIISHNPSATLYALSLYISPRLLRCRALPLVIAPASFFAPSPLLIDRYRRKTLHTLQRRCRRSCCSCKAASHAKHKNEAYCYSRFVVCVVYLLSAV